MRHVTRVASDGGRVRGVESIIARTSMSPVAKKATKKAAGKSTSAKAASGFTAEEKAGLAKSSDAVSGLIEACKKLEPKLA